MKRVTILLMACLALSGAAATLRADSVAARMEVTATVPANCRLTVPPLSFGTYDPLVANAAAPADASTIVQVSCTRNLAATFSFDLGLHAGGGQDRAMTGGGGDRLLYEIYRDAARSQSWRSGADTVRILSTSAATPQELTVFGRIPPRQEVQPGGYNDVLTAAVDF